MGYMGTASAVVVAIWTMTNDLAGLLVRVNGPLVVLVGDHGHRESHGGLDNVFAHGLCRRLQLCFWSDW